MQFRIFLYFCIVIQTIDVLNIDRFRGITETQYHINPRKTMDKDFSVKISIGSGKFNDIVINDKEAKPLHCHIIFNKDGFHVHRASREATVYINGKEMENRYADIEKNDELRIGNEILNLAKYFNVLINQMKEAEAEEERKKEEKKLENQVALIMLVHYIIYFGLGFFLLWSIADGSTLWIIISAVLFSAYCLFNIISNILSKKNKTEENIKTRKYFNRYRIIIFIALIPIIFKMCNKQAELDNRFQQRQQNFEQYMASTDHTRYYRVVYNTSGHDVVISYRPYGEKDTLLTFQIAQGAYDTIAYVSDFDTHMRKRRVLNFTKDGVTMTFDDSTYITHQLIEPAENNILSISSWMKDTTNGPVAVYTITPEIHTDALHTGAQK